MALGSFEPATIWLQGSWWNRIYHNTTVYVAE